MDLYDKEQILEILDGLNNALASIVAALVELDARVCTIESRPAQARCMCMNRYGSN